MLEAIPVNKFMMNYLHYWKIIVISLLNVGHCSPQKKSPVYVIMAWNLIKHRDNLAFILVGWAPSDLGSQVISPLSIQ
jgi:hypothetical protein